MQECAVYILAPVRGVTDAQRSVVVGHVEKLRGEGREVLDTMTGIDQNDPTGYGIVAGELAFLRALAEKQGEVHMFWTVGDTVSEGSRVDLGMAIAFGLKLQLIQVFGEGEKNGNCIDTIKELTETGNLGGCAFSKRLAVFLADLRDKASRGESVKLLYHVDRNYDDYELERVQLGMAIAMTAYGLQLQELEVIGEDPKGKSYPKAVAEMLRRQNGRNS
jgi:hypothetical protein